MGESIRKYIRFTILALRVSGLYTDYDDFSKSKLYWTYSLVINGFFMTLMNIGMVMFPILYWKEVNIAQTNAYLTITFVMPSVKIYFYLRNWKVIRNLIDRLDEEAFQPKNRRQKLLIEGFFKYQNSIHLLYAVLGTPMLSLWYVIPLITAKEKKLPFLTWIPFDWKQPIVYELTYVHQVIGGICTVMVNVHMDMIFFGFTSYIATEFDLVSDTLRNIRDFARQGMDEEKDELEWNGKMERALLGCIQHHKKILRFAHDTDAFFSVLLFLQFVSSLFSLCLTMYELTVIPSILEALAILLYQLAVFAELLYYCFFGHEIITRSAEVASALYETPWMDSSQHFKRTLLFFLIRAQKPVQLRGLNFFVLSLPTCASIYRISWSFFMLLYSTQNTV